MKKGERLLKRLSAFNGKLPTNKLIVYCSHARILDILLCSIPRTVGVCTRGMFVNLTEGSIPLTIKMVGSPERDL